MSPSCFLSHKCDNRFVSKIREGCNVWNKIDERERANARNLHARTNKIKEGLKRGGVRTRPKKLNILLAYLHLLLFLPFFLLSALRLPHRFFKSYYVVVRAFTIKGQDASSILQKYKRAPFRTVTARKASSALADDAFNRYQCKEKN